MSEPDDCTCEGNALNERLKGRTNYHDEDGLMPPNSLDDVEYPEGYVKMEGKNIGKIVGKFIAQVEPSDSDRMTDAEFDKAMELLKEIHEACPTPEKIERDILNERLNKLEKQMEGIHVAFLKLLS